MNGLHDLLSTGLAYRLGWTLLHSLWQGVVVAGLFGLALLVIPARRPNVRYVLGCVSLMTLVVVCAVTFAMLEGPGTTLMPVVADVEPVVVEVGPIANAPVERVQEVALADKPPVAQMREVASVPAEPWHKQAITKLRTTITPALPWLAGAWLTGVLVLSLWRCGGLFATYRVRRIATLAVPDYVREAVFELGGRLRISRPVRTLQSAVISTPAVIGHLRPVILLPVAAVTGLSARELEAILAHELAHIRRYDYLVNILQTSIETLLFHHPAVWWMSRRIRAERENCCDDIALAVCGDRLTYARALAQVEQLGSGDYGLAAAASGGSLLERIRRIVDGSGSSVKTWTTWIPGAVTIVLVLAALLGSRMRTVGASGPTTQPDNSVSDKLSEVPPGLVAFLVKDSEGKPISIGKVVQWSLSLRDSENNQSRLGIEDRLPDGSVLIKPPRLPSSVEPGCRMSIKVVSELGQPIRAIGRFPLDDQPRMVFVTDQKLWTSRREKQALKGKVVDENGQPVFGAKVELVNPEMLSEPMQVPMAPGSGVYSPSDTAIANTDKDGSFVFEALNEGRTDVMVTHLDYQSMIVRDFPTGIAALEIRLGRPKPFPIAGKVADTQGQPVAGAEVLLVERSHSASPRSAPRVMTASSDASGSFRFPGEFEPISTRVAQSRTLIVRKPGYGIWGRMLDKTGGEAFVPVALAPAKAVRGRVVDIEGKSVAGAEVWMWQLRSVSDSPLDCHYHYMDMEERAPRTRTDEQGRFALEGLPPHCIVSLSTSAAGYALQRTFNVETGLSGLEIELEREAVLRGQVLRGDNNAPVPGVHLGVQGLKSSNWAETISDAQGRFELRGLKAEAVNLLPMLDRGEPGEAPEWTAAAIEIKQVEPGQTLDDLEIVLIKGGIVRGQVTDKDDRPLEGVDIAFYSAARPRSGAACEYTHTDRDGKWAYRFPPGAVHVYIRDSFPGGTWSKSSYDLDVEAGETVEGIDFKLSTAVAPPASQPAANTEVVKPDKLQVAIEAKIAIVPTDVDRELRKQFPTSEELSPQLWAGDTLSMEQATQLLQDLIEKKVDPKDFPRVVVPDGRTAYNGLVTSSTPVAIDGVEYDPPQRRLEVGVDVAKDRKRVAATINANLKAFLAENGTHIEETVKASGELTLEDRAWVLLRAPVQRERITLRETSDPAKQPSSALSPDKYAYIILRATIVGASDFKRLSVPDSAGEPSSKAGTASPVNAVELDTQSVLEKIRKAEAKLENVKIEFDSHVELKPAGATEWQKTQRVFSGTSWYGSVASGKGRISVERFVSPWTNGAADYYESKVDYGYDGKEGRRVEHEGGPLGTPGRVGRGYTSKQTPDALRVAWTRCASGAGYSLFFIQPFGGGSFSSMLASHKDATFSNTTLDGNPAVLVTVPLSSGQAGKYWLDPAKGYGVVAMSVTNQAGDVLVSLAGIDLVDAGGGVWFPREGMRVEHGENPAEMIRTHYKARSVVVNDPKFDDNVFTVPIPPGYRVVNRGLFHVAGKVRRPGPYQLSPGLTLRRALLAAGGIEPAEQKTTIICRIERRQDDEHPSPTIIEVDDLNAVLSGERADIEIHPSDVIRVESKDAKKPASAPAETRSAKSAPAESDSTSHSRDILPQLIERLSSSDPMEQERAANQLGGMKDYAVSAVPELVKLLGESSPKSLRTTAARALSRMGLAAVDPLIALLTSDADTRTRGEIAVILTRITGKDFGTDGAKWEQWWRVEREQLEAVRRSMGLQSNTPDHRQGMYIFDWFRLDEELVSPTGLRHDLPADMRITFKKSGGELVGDVRLTMPEWADGKWRLTLRLGRGEEELVLRKAVFENESETGLEASVRLSCGDSEKLAQAAWYSLSLERARTGETLTTNVTKKSANVPGIRGSDAITREYLMEMEHQALREYSATTRPAADLSASPKRPGTPPKGQSAVPQDNQADYAWGKPVEDFRLEKSTPGETGIAKSQSAEPTPKSTKTDASSVAGRMRRFVRLIASEKRVCFEGQETSWDKLPALLDKVPDRAHTVFEFGLETPVGRPSSAAERLSHLRERARELAEENRFEMFNDTGPVPMNSMGTASQFVPDSPGSELDESGPWGAEVEQVECALRADRQTWRAGETPWLWAWIRHHREHRVVLAPGENVDGLIVDGVWHACWWGKARPFQHLEPGTPSRDYLYLLGQNWRRVVDNPPSSLWARMLAGKPKRPSFSKGGWRIGEPLQLAAGRHTIQVAIEVSDQEDFRSGHTIQVISNPVEIEIVPAVPESMTQE